MKYNNLRLTQPTAEYSMRTCGPYWYLVTTNGISHVAFTRRESLLKWLDERSLQLSADLVDEGEFSTQEIVGTYSDVMHMSHRALYDIPEPILETRTLSNGKYTRAYIIDGPCGREVHFLNSNVKNRMEFDYQESRALFG